MRPRDNAGPRCFSTAARLGADFSLKRDLRSSAESAKSTAPSRSRLSGFNARIMSRARKPAVGLATAVIPLLLAGVIVRAQQDAPPLFRSETRVVVCNTTVVDKNGHLVTDLSEANFTVFENGAQQKIAAFKHEDVPVSLGLVIDNSGSMRTKRAGVEATYAELNSTWGHDAFLIEVEEQSYLIMHFLKKVMAS